MQWRVIATHPSGQKEHIIGFATEAEAIDWLASKGSQAWRMARLIARGDMENNQAPQARPPSDRVLAA
jgi:hypothetical protein